MNNYIILDKKKYIKKINKIISECHLKNTLNNHRTSMWENDDIEINIDKRLIRVYIYDDNNISHYSKKLL